MQKTIDELTIMSDFIFGIVMRQERFCKPLLEFILGIKIKKLVYHNEQESITVGIPNSKSIRLDVYAEDDAGTVYDIEVQTTDKRNLGKRTRYYQSMIDIDSLMKGADYSELKESFVIFICLDDPFEENLPLYTFERKCRENPNVDLKDETHHLIFNAAAYEKETKPEIKEFLSFVKNNKADSDFTRRIAQMVQTKKFENTFVNEYMAWNLHDMDVERRAKAEGRKEGRKEGITEGMNTARAETAKNLFSMGLSVENIAKATELSLDFVKELFS